MKEEGARPLTRLFNGLILFGCVWWGVLVPAMPPLLSPAWPSFLFALLWCSFRCAAGCRHYCCLWLLTLAWLCSSSPPSLASCMPAASGVLSGVRREGEGDTAVGTWPYLAPEYKAGGTLTIKADVYALGVSLLQVTGGKLLGEAPGVGGLRRWAGPRGNSGGGGGWGKS